MSTISVKGKVTKKMFYNEGFGVYSFVMVASDQEVKRDKVWGTTVVSGKCPHLTEGNVYDFVIEPSTSKKYGDGYAFVSFEAPEVSSVAGQQELLRQSTSENHANTIIKAYPNGMIVDLIKQDKVDVSKLKGIKEKALAKIKDKLIKLEALEHALVELKDLNITVEALERLIEHFGSQEALVEAVKENIYSLTQVSMFGFKRVDEFAMKRGDDPTNDKRIIASFRYIMEEESQKGHTWIGLDSLLPTARDLLNIDVEYIHEQIQLIEEGKKRQFKIVNNRFTLTKYYKMEQEIKSNLDRLMKAFEPFVENVDIEKIESNSDIELTDEQMNGLNKSLTNGVSVINGVAGSGKCVKGDTLIFTEKGMMRIDQIPNEFEVNENDELEVDIVSYDTQVNKSFKKTSHFYNMGLSKTIKITTSQGYTVEGTPEHPVMIINENGDFEFKKLKDFKKNEVIPISINNNLFSTSDVIDEDIAYWMGLLVGDGSLNASNTKGNKYNIAFTNSNQNIINDYVNITNDKFGVKVGVYKYKEKYSLQFANRELFNRIKNEFDMPLCTSHFKYIPKTILQSSKSVVKAFLQGLFDTDASVGTIGFEFSTSSVVIANQVHTMLLNFGIPSKLKEKKVKGYEHNQYFRIIFSSRYALKKFYEEIGFKNELNKQKRLQELVNSETSINDNLNLLHNLDNKLEDIRLHLLINDSKFTKKTGYRVYLQDGNDYSFLNYKGKRINKNGMKRATSSQVMKLILDDRKDLPHYEYLHNVVNNTFIDIVESIEESECVVYDFTVPETHSFVGNGIINHNTTMMKTVLDNLPMDKKYIACALSGRAVQVLQSKGIEAQTIHSLIGNEEAIQSFDVVVVDESSMVNLELFHTLITNMNDGQQLILVGDNGQLPPIGVGSVFDDLLYSDVYPRQELTKIHRQAAESGIISASHKVRHGNQITTYNQSSKEVFGVNGDMVLFPMDRDKIQSNVLSVVSAYFKKHGEKLFEDFMVLTPVKQKGDNSVMLLNNKIQEIVNFSQEEGVKKGITTFLTGDRVIHNGNKEMKKVENVSEYNHLMKNEMNMTHSTKVYNGTTGRILKVDYENEHILIKWEFHEGVHVYEFKDVKLFDLAYASTIHRSQGMGIKNVVMVLDYIAFNMLSKQLVYTGFTRASEKLVVFCENAALHKAIKTDLGSTRRTFLKEILKGELIE